MCAISIAPENINAVIAASAALSGVVISLLGNWLLSWLKEGYERKILLRSKYEELSFLLVDSIGDYQQILTAHSNRELLNTQPVSAQKMFALAQLYFPELLVATDVYLSALVAFRNSCAAASANQPQKSWPEALVSSPDVVQAQEALYKSKEDIQSLLLAYSKQYTLA